MKVQLLKSDCRGASGGYPRYVEESRCSDLPADLAGDNLRGRKRAYPRTDSWQEGCIFAVLRTTKRLHEILTLDAAAKERNNRDAAKDDDRHRRDNRSKQEHREPGGET